MDNEIELFAAAQNGDSKAIDTIFYKYKRCAESIAAQFETIKQYVESQKKRGG